VAVALAADQKPHVDVPLVKCWLSIPALTQQGSPHRTFANAILGDTFVRLLGFAGREIDIQNYIDNTGVQVADVVVAFCISRRKSRAESSAWRRSRASTSTAGISTRVFAVVCAGQQICRRG